MTSTPAAYTTPQATFQPTVALGSIATNNYRIVAYSGISNSGPSTVCGGVALSPAAGSFYTGSPAIVVNCSGTTDLTNTAAGIAQSDLTIAYNDAAGRTGGATLPPNADIGGQTLYPGLYTEGGTLSVSSADLTLDALGNPNAVFIFQSAGVLNITSGRQVILAGGALSTNVYWEVASNCSIGTTASMVGVIMAHTSVTLNTGAVLHGRALGSIGNVTLLSNTLTN